MKKSMTPQIALLILFSFAVVAVIIILAWIAALKVQIDPCEDISYVITDLCTDETAIHFNAENKGDLPIMLEIYLGECFYSLNTEFIENVKTPITQESECIKESQAIFVPNIEGKICKTKKLEKEIRTC